MKLICLLLIVGLFHFSTSQSGLCPIHAEFKFGHEPPCMRTCEKPIVDPNCRSKLKLQCFCKEGFLFDSKKNGSCVLKKDCNKRDCPANSYYRLGVPHACINSCQNRGDVIQCTNQLSYNCYCREGYIYDMVGKKCVLERDCPSKTCPENAEFRLDWPCRRTCKNPLSSGCNKQLKYDCYCKSGYVYDEIARKCVLPEQCRRKCLPNSSYRLDFPYSCAPTCQNRREELKCDSPKNFDCYCYPGFIFDMIARKCVQPATCPKPKCPPPKCGENEVYEMGSPCPKTCQNKNMNLQCKMANKMGCYCKAGYIFDAITNKCTPKNRCPSPCMPNASFRLSSPCVRTCQNLYQNMNCDNLLRYGCFCDKGYVFDLLSHSCVMESHCHLKSCGRNEELRLGSSVVRTCQNLGERLPYGPNVILDCYCKAGYVMDEDTYCCVLEKDCPKGTPDHLCQDDEETIDPLKICLDPNTEYNKCGTSCPVTCENMFYRYKGCESKCVPGCFCKSGYVFDTISRKCVAECDCPRCKCDGSSELRSVHDELSEGSECHHLGCKLLRDSLEIVED